MADRPRFSIAVPAYNAAATIDATIRSVLAQDFDGWELVITDDGSTDETRAICDRYAADDQRIHVASQPNAGTGAALDASIRRSTGAYIVQLGADDELLPAYCSETASFIDAHPGYDIYASNAYRLLPDGTRSLYHQRPRFERVFSMTTDDVIDECEIYGTAAFRRELYEQVGGFRTEFYNEDFDFWLRAMMAGAKHIYDPVPLALYRVVAGQKSEDAIRMRLADIRVLEDAIASGRLTAEQADRARGVVRLARRNVAFRRVLGAIVPRPVSAAVFKAAHRLAWIVRPNRRKR